MYRKWLLSIGIILAQGETRKIQPTFSIWQNTSIQATRLYQTYLLEEKLYWISFSNYFYVKASQLLHYPFMQTMQSLLLLIRSIVRYYKTYKVPEVIWHKQQVWWQLAILLMHWKQSDRLLWLVGRNQLSCSDWLEAIISTALISC